MVQVEIPNVKSFQSIIYGTVVNSTSRSQLINPSCSHSLKKEKEEKQLIKSRT